MSEVDSEQEKQPISSINGQTGNGNIQPPGKDVTDDQTPPMEGVKGTADTETAAPVSCQSESMEIGKDDGVKDETKETESAEMAVNGVNPTVDHQGKSEQVEDLGESYVEETKPSETHEELSEDKQINGGDIGVEARKEGESSAKIKEAEQNYEAVAIETNGEQGEVLAESKEVEESHEPVAMETNGEQGETSPANKESEQNQEVFAMETKGEQVGTSAESKEPEQPVAVDTKGEQDKVETVASEVESAPTEVEEGTEVEGPDVTLSEQAEKADQHEDQPSEETKVTETDSDVVEKKRSVTIDSPENLKEPDEVEDKTKQGRSKTIGDIEGSVTSPLKEDVAERSKTIWYVDDMGDTTSKPDSLAPEETVSYSTSIVGGVVHRVPIDSYSPKGQRKAREGSPQTSPKKKSVIETLFGRRKKSKGGRESPPGAASPDGKDNEKEKQELPQSNPVTPDASADTTMEDSSQPLENGTGAEVGDTSGADKKQETEGKPAAAVEEGGGEVEIKPAVAERSEEGIKEETVQDSELPKQAGDGNLKEESVPVESVPQEKDKESPEEPKAEESDDKDSKEIVQQEQNEFPEEEASSEPPPKKKKSTGIFGGFFARRKSKKSKDGAASAPVEKEQGDKVEQPQDESLSTQPAGEVTGTIGNGTGAEVGDTSGADNKQETEGKPEAAVEEGGGEVEVKPAVAEPSEEGIKEETVQDSEMPKQAEDGKEESVPVEGVPQEKDKECPEEPKAKELEDKDSKEAVKRAHSEPPEEEISPEPAQKKKKSTGIVDGFFARRKSKKSNDGAASSPAEKEQGDKVEQRQDESVSTQPAGEVTGKLENGTDQGMAPDARDAAGSKGQEDSASPQQEVTEGVISAAVDQTVESAKEEVADKDKVDASIGAEATVSDKPEMESGTVAEKPGAKEIESAVSEDIRPSPSADKAAKDVSLQETPEPVTAQDNQAKAQPDEEHLIQPKVEVNNMAAVETEDKPKVDEPKTEETGKVTGVERPPSPEAEEAEDEDTALRERVALKKDVSPSYSPKTRRMQMRISYAEKDGEGGREVEVIGTPEKVPEPTNQKGKRDDRVSCRVSCRALGEVDYEGWLAKKGGMLFLPGWKRKWVVLKDGKLYYFKTAFDPEASGVINMEGVTVAEAPETKKNFCFKCVQPGAKPQASVFMADSKEDMDKWLTVLAAASRGEVIQKPKQHHLNVTDGVVMRKKSGSTSAQRHSSVLAVGGRHDFLEDEEDLKATRRRSTPGSFSKVPKETENEGEETAVTHPTPIDKQPADSDGQAAPSSEQPASIDTPQAPSDDQAAAPIVKQPTDSEEDPATVDEQPAAPSDSPLVSAPSDESQKEKVEECKTTEKTITVVVDEVFVGSEKVVVESTVSSVEVTKTEQEQPAAESSDDAVPVVSPDEGKESEESSKVPVEVAAETEKRDSPAEAESTVDKTGGVVSVTTTESSVAVVETVKTSVEISETVETSTVVSVVETEVQSSQETSETVQLKLKVKEEVSEATSSSEPLTSKPSDTPPGETSSSAPLESEPLETPPAESSSSTPLASEPAETAPLASEPSEGTPAESVSGTPESPSKTKWYFSLDRKQTWSIAPELEDEQSSKRPKSSDRGSIKSTSSDKGSIKSLPDDDELMVMCRNIRQARLSIVGEPVMDGEQRMRAFSSPPDSKMALVKLRTLERTLKDKEQHLADLEELLNQPEINRRSIYEWKLRNSELLEELFPQEDGFGQEEDENAAEGGEGESQKPENLAGEEKEENVEETAEKLDEAKEESKEGGDGNVDEKMSTPEGEEKGEEEQKADEEKEKEQGKEKESDTEGDTEGQQSPPESSPLTETETTDGKQEQEKDVSAESSSAQKSSEESEEQQESEETLDTRL